MTSGKPFRPADRIRKRSEYRRVYDRGEKISSRSFTLFILENDRNRPRLGITVTRRMGGAVQRNRVKRVLREWFRQNQEGLPPVDLVINPREGMDRREGDSVARELASALARRRRTGGR